MLVIIESITRSILDAFLPCENETIILSKLLVQNSTNVCGSTENKSFVPPISGAMDIRNPRNKRNKAFIWQITVDILTKLTSINMKNLTICCVEIRK